MWHTQDDHEQFRNLTDGWRRWYSSKHNAQFVLHFLLKAQRRDLWSLSAFMNKCNIMIINSINETSRETWRTLVTTSPKSYSLIGKEASNENNLSQRSIAPPPQYWQTILQYNASNHRRNTTKPNITALCSTLPKTNTITPSIPYVRFCIHAYMQLVLWTLFFFVWPWTNEVKADIQATTAPA